jgi:protein ImuB
MLAAEREPSLLFDLARGRLEQARIPAPVRGLRLVAEELPPFVPAGRELFDERSSQAMSWTILRERLRARLGDDAVYGLAPADDHRPERAWRRTPLPAGTKPEIEPAPRPTWLLQRPIPLRDSTLRILAGPERVESGWWDGGDVRRDYYVVETSSGQRAWTYRGVGETDTPFMLHGWFS